LSGQKAIAQRFTALDAERKTLENRKLAIDTAEEHLHKMMSEGNVSGALDYLFDAMGYNSQEVYMHLIQDLSPMLQQYQSLTPEQQQTWAAQMKAERHRIELDKLRNQQSQLQAQQEQLAEVKRVQEIVGLDDATFAQRFDELAQEMEKGYIKQQDITAELVGNYHILRERQEWTSEALQQVRPDLAQDASLINDVLRVISKTFDAQNKPVGKEDVEAIIAKAYGKPALKEKSEKVHQALVKKGNPVAKKITNSNPKSKSLREPTSHKHFLEAAREMTPEQFVKALDKWAK
jgi:hypothetical protein